MSNHSGWSQIGCLRLPTLELPLRSMLQRSNVRLLVGGDFSCFKKLAAHSQRQIRIVGILCQQLQCCEQLEPYSESPETGAHIQHPLPCMASKANLRCSANRFKSRVSQEDLSASTSTCGGAQVCIGLMHHLKGPEDKTPHVWGHRQMSRST